MTLWLAICTILFILFFFWRTKKFKKDLNEYDEESDKQNP